MPAAKNPPNETQRLTALRSYEILDTLPEQMFDDITLLAAAICDSPIALISLVDEERQWFKSKVGLEAVETPRELAFCAHAILDSDNLMLVPDTFKDDRFATNELVTGAPNIRFYAGAPIIGSDGSALGTVCVIDNQPRQLNATQRECLRALSRQVSHLLEYRLLRTIRI